MHHLYYISAFFARKQKERGVSIRNPVVHGLPAVPLLLSFAGAYVVTSTTESMFYVDPTTLGLLKHVAVGCVCLILQAGIVAMADYGMLRQVRSLLLGGGLQKKKDA